MQTFLPWADLEQSARTLDMHRLGKQRSETMQIMGAILNKRVTDDTKDTDGPYELEDFVAPARVRRHWVTLSWEVNLDFLLAYQVAVCEEWARRGYKDTCLVKTHLIYETSSKFRCQGKPSWFGMEPFHLGHRSQLLQKNPEFYEHLFPPNTPTNLEYMRPRG